MIARRTDTDPQGLYHIEGAGHLVYARSMYEAGARQLAGEGLSVRHPLSSHYYPPREGEPARLEMHYSGRTLVIRRACDVVPDIGRALVSQIATVNVGEVAPCR